MNEHASRTRGRFAWTLAAAAWASLPAMFAGCSSAPTTNYYTLMPPAAASEQGTAAATPLDWDVLSVAVPAQVDQPQWVVRTADGGVTILEQERWIAPLADEIRGAVVERLTKSFGPPRMTYAAGATPTWRIRINVQRFDLLLNREARLDADWSLRGDAASATCHTSISEPIQMPGFAGLAQAQQQAVGQLAAAIGVALRAAGKVQAIAC